MVLKEGGLWGAIAVLDWGVDKEGVRFWSHSPGHAGYQRVDEALHMGSENVCVHVRVCVCSLDALVYVHTYMHACIVGMSVCIWQPTLMTNA